jgi:hypothetical protein
LSGLRKRALLVLADGASRDLVRPARRLLERGMAVRERER